MKKNNYDEIDVPEFMKNRVKKVEVKQEEPKQDIEKAYLKGGLLGILTTFTIIGMMILLAVIEHM